MAVPGTEFTWRDKDYVVGGDGRIFRIAFVANEHLPHLGDFWDDAGSLSPGSLLLEDLDWSLHDLEYEILERGVGESKVRVSGDPSYVILKLEVEAATFWIGTPWAR